MSEELPRKSDSLEELMQFITDNQHLDENELLRLIEEKFTEETINKYTI